MHSYIQSLLFIFIASSSFLSATIIIEIDEPWYYNYLQLRNDLQRNNGKAFNENLERIIKYSEGIIYPKEKYCWKKTLTYLIGEVLFYFPKRLGTSDVAFYTSPYKWKHIQFVFSNPQVRSFLYTSPLPGSKENEPLCFIDHLESNYVLNDDQRVFFITQGYTQHKIKGVK